jgi:hypothetical protein
MLPRESASHFPSREVQKSKISPARLLQAATTEPEAQTNDEARGEAVADSHKRFDLRPTDLASHHRLDEAVGAAATFVRRLVTPGSSGKSKQNGSNFVPVSQPLRTTSRAQPVVPVIGFLEGSARVPLNCPSVAEL